MDKQRLVVSNNSKTVETEVDGKWSIQKVESPNGLKAGVYNLHQAHDVARSSQQQIEGTILHADKAKVYQAVGKDLIVAYQRNDFAKEPPIGEHVTVNYSNGRAAVAERSRDLER